LWNVRTSEHPPGPGRLQGSQLHRRRQPTTSVRSQDSCHLDERPAPTGRAGQLTHADGSVVIEGDHQAV
jgi:hypothetical protein